MCYGYRVYHHDIKESITAKSYYHVNQGYKQSLILFTSLILPSLLTVCVKKQYPKIRISTFKLKCLAYPLFKLCFLCNIKPTTSVSYTTINRTVFHSELSFRFLIAKKIIDLQSHNIVN